MVPSWATRKAGTRENHAGGGYASLLPSHRDDDRLSPVDAQHRRVSTALSDAPSATSYEGANNDAAAAPPKSGPAAGLLRASLGIRDRSPHMRLASDEPLKKATTEPRTSFSSTPQHSKSTGKRLSLDVFHRKSSGEKNKAKKNEKVKAEKASATTRLASTGSGKTTKAPKKAEVQAQTVLELITGLNTVYTSNGGSTSAIALPPTKPLPDVTSKQIKRLKASLTDAKEAKQIIGELKKIPLDGNTLRASNPTDASASVVTRAVCLECTDGEAFELHAQQHAKSPFADSESAANEGERRPSQASSATLAANGSAQPKATSSKNTAFDLFSGKFQILSQMSGDSGAPSPGKILGQVASSTGAFNALAGVTGRLVEASGSHEGLVTPPIDQLSILVYWWGYELVIPPPSLAYLGQAHSVAGTLFTFLQALAMSGGVPEIAPFVRYLSLYIDMEWKAISAQNKGKGVVLAATWVVPVAVVPRPFDFTA